MGDILGCGHPRHGHPWSKAKEKDATSWPLDMLHIQIYTIKRANTMD